MGETPAVAVPHPSPDMAEHDPNPKHPPTYAVQRPRRSAVSSAILLLLLLLGIAALILWLLYRPSEPTFRVASAAVYQLNTTSPPLITATMQFTVVTRNPSSRVTIYYDRLVAYVVYKNQPITAPADLPPLFHETKTTVALSPVLGGSPVPVTAETANGLQMDQKYGMVGLTLVVRGRVKYKGGDLWRRRKGVYVGCDLYVGLKKGFVGQLTIIGSPPCTVHA